ncbi:hypothetical protein [Thermaurantimonas aggregans]|nr:hypothetical protein [Thermaurantimonas aggregans]MCX8148197.1 hypothetical protein [Thermaurantimonas aggregans]
MKRHLATLIFVSAILLLLSSCRSKEKCPAYSQITIKSEANV